MVSALERRYLENRALHGTKQAVFQSCFNLALWCSKSVSLIILFSQLCLNNNNFPRQCLLWNVNLTCTSNYLCFLFPFRFKLHAFCHIMLVCNSNYTYIVQPGDKFRFWQRVWRDEAIEVHIYSFTYISSNQRFAQFYWHLWRIWKKMKLLNSGQWTKLALNLLMYYSLFSSCRITRKLQQFYEMPKMKNRFTV